MPRLPTTAAICLVALASACATGDTRKLPAGRGSQEIGLVRHTDEIGRQVSIPARPERIISLAPSVTEILFMLGAGDRLIGVTSHCTWPAEALAKPRVADLLNPNYERVLAANPDLVIASTAGNDRTAVLKLAELGLQVYVTAPRTLDAIWDSVLAIGRITGRSEAAAELVERGRGRLDLVRERLAGLPSTRALFITWFDPLLVPGKNTFETSVLRSAGVDSISADVDEYYPRFSLEQILARQPEVILTVENMGQPLPDLRHLPGWRILEPVRKNRIHVLPEVLQHPSPRVVEGVEDLARRLHPERFP